MRTSLYGKRHWTANVTPSVILFAETDWSGEGDRRFGTGQATDIQILGLSIGWLFWSKQFRMSWRYR